MTTLPVRALIIDDDRSFRKLLELRIRAFVDQVSFTSCNSLAEAREHLSGGTDGYDIVILDEHLPDGRGVELLREGLFEGKAVLCVSSDPSPEIPGSTVREGAMYFLNKVEISEPLFEPLVQGIIDRASLQRELERARIDRAVLDTVNTLVATLRHEIKNPLGAVLGAAYLLRKSNAISDEQREAAELVESSGKRINHVLEQLCKAISVEKVNKGNHEVFHIPGDKEWE